MREAFGPGYQQAVVFEQHLQRVAAASCQPNRIAGSPAVHAANG